MDRINFNPADWQRRFEIAVNNEKNAETDITQSAVDIAKERTQYFEKLSIGVGATIAAIVSFLGAHSGGLQPKWLLRVALLSLLTALVAALFRNLRYPHYVLAAKQKVWMKRERERRKIEHEAYGIKTVVQDEITGKILDEKAATEDFLKNDKQLEDALQNKLKEEQQHEREWHGAENLCLAAVSVAMIALVWLALCNF